MGLIPGFIVLLGLGGAAHAIPNPLCYVYNCGVGVNNNGVWSCNNLPACTGGKFIVCTCGSAAILNNQGVQVGLNCWCQP